MSNLGSGGPLDGAPIASSLGGFGVEFGRFGPVDVDPEAGAFFDIDNTIVRGASIFALARGLLRRKILTPADMLGFGWKQAKFVLAGTEDLDDMAKIQTSALEIIKDQPVDEMRGIADEVFEKYMVDKLWPGTLAIAQSHLDVGQRVWLVSATPIEVAEVIADRLGLSGAIGTRSQIVDGRYTGKLIGVPMHGEAKAEAVRELAEELQLNLSKCSAYSDSANDIPMLSLVGNPVAINPDHELRGRARTQGWQIRDYRSRRFALKIGVPAAALLGFGSGLALGAVLGSRTPAAG
ncbi:MAG: HAD-IB family hydrolase [Candidatus Nanopelagicales bacterium]